MVHRVEKKIFHILPSSGWCFYCHGVHFHTKHHYHHHSTTTNTTIGILYLSPPFSQANDLRKT